MPLQPSQQELQGLQELLRPVVRFCLRHSLALRPLVATAKKVLAEEAVKVLRAAGEDSSASRIAIITGLHRADVTKLNHGKELLDTPNSVLTRVVGAWTNKRKFSVRPGQPLPLTFEGQNSEFSKLVQTVSKEISPYTILRELERVGAVLTKGDRILLQASEYVPKGDSQRSWQLVGRDVDDLLRAAESNIEKDERVQNLHLKTEFDNINVSHIQAIKAWMIEEGAAFHDKARRFLARFDLDHEPSSSNSDSGGARAVIGTFSLVEEPSKTSAVTKRKRGRKKTVGKSLLTLLLLSFLALHTTGCGGGTSGTSGTDPRRLQGQVHTPSGTPAAALPMIVFSDEEATVSTDTDTSGGFEMKLPGSAFSIQLGTNSDQKLLANAYLAAPSTLSLDITRGSNNMPTTLDVLEASATGSEQCFAAHGQDFRDISLNPSSSDLCVVTISVVKNGSFTISPELQTAVELKQLCEGGKTRALQLGPDRTLKVNAGDLFGACLNASISVLHKSDRLEFWFMKPSKF